MKISFWQLPVMADARGALSVVEESNLPFRFKRVYFLYNTKEKRGGHAHKKEKEVFICIKGSFTARAHDGRRWQTFQMKKPGQALYTDAMVWHEFDNFSPGAIMLALSSTLYKGQKEYIMDFELFKKLCAKKSS